MRSLIASVLLFALPALAGASQMIAPDAVGGNASSATALAVDPADCAANKYANAINTTGDLACATVTYEQVTGSVLTITSTLFASLGTATAGKVKFCSDCNRATTCAGGGTGALAVANGTIWSCD